MTKETTKALKSRFEHKNINKKQKNSITYIIYKRTQQDTKTPKTGLHLESHSD